MTNVTVTAVEKGLRLNAEAVEAKLQEMAKEVNGKLLAHKLYSNHPEDSFLYTVLVKLEVEFQGKAYPKYVTWLANLDCGGFNGGHYFEDVFEKTSADALLDRARKDYNERNYKADLPRFNL